jgi:DNA-binding XRE family transcriptional regulator
MEQVTVTIQQLIDACRGPRTRRALCKQLGVSERYLYDVYKGQREPGLKILRSICVHFPEHQSQVVLFFLARMGQDTAQKAE